MLPCFRKECNVDIHLLVTRAPGQNPGSADDLLREYPGPTVTLIQKEEGLAITLELEGGVPHHIAIFPVTAQDGKAGQAIVYLKLFTPDSSFTWYILEGSPVNDEECNDFQFFGLVDGHEKELGYFYLSELESVKGSLGLPVERDLWWKPKTLTEIAPEKFKEGAS